MAKKKKRNYKKAWGILMDYWEYIPNEDKQEVDKQLQECGL